jgi:DNA repair protein RadC
VLVSRGDVDGTDASARAIMRTALVADAVSVMIAHNHPSGNVNPSAADNAVTTRIVVAGRAVDVPLVDHIIIAPPDKWYSLRREHPELWRS